MRKLFTAALAASLITGTAVAASADALQQLDGDTATGDTTAITVAGDACDAEQTFDGRVRLKWNGSSHYDSGSDVTLVTLVTPSGAGVTAGGSTTPLGTWDSNAADKFLSFTITVGTEALDGDYGIAVSSTGNGYSVTGPPTDRRIEDRNPYELPAGSVTVTVDCGRTAPAENSAPTITDLELTRDPDDVCTVKTSVTWTDADAGDSHSVTFDWGDSSSTVVDPATSPTSRSHNYATAGTYTVEVTVSDGSDTDVESGSFTAYNTPSGILQPINANGTSSFKINSTIPVKISVLGCDSQPVSTIAPTISLSYDGGVAPLVNETVVSTSAADTGNVMRWSPDGLQYIYNLATKNRAAGQYTLTIDHESFETPVTAIFGLRK